jgi:glycosyltransferase involved in cell wall biosynthesis
MQKKKVLFIIPSFVGGGAERTLINLLNLLTMEDLEIELVSVLGKGPYLDQIPSYVKLTILTKNEIFLKLITKLHQKFNFFFPLKLLFKRKVKGNFDAGISFLDCIYTEFLHIQSKDIHFKKKITWVHSSYKSYNNFYKFYKKKKYNKRLRKERYSNLDTIVFVSNDAKKEFIELFGVFPDMPVIYNPINKDKIKLMALNNDMLSFKKKDVFTFIAIGSLIPVKNYTLLINATRLLLQKTKEFEVQIFGSGYLESQLLDLIKNYNLSEHIFLKGFVNNPYPFLKSADAFIMTSLTEALPTALIEAMIFSKPVIVTNVSGCKEIVNDGEFGIISELNDVDLSEKMMELMVDKEKYNHFVKQSTKRALIFDDDVFLERFTKLLSNENNSD